MRNLGLPLRTKTHIVDSLNRTRTRNRTDVIDEVSGRTPGFSGWQQERWLVHCGDACAFLGPAGRTEIRILLELPIYLSHCARTQRVTNQRHLKDMLVGLRIKTGVQQLMCSDAFIVRACSVNSDSV